jgi:protocatechuate 3,4-dioxygenase alpha subunit
MPLPRTPSQTVGPYYSIGLCRRRDNDLAPGGTRLHGRVLDGAGDPVDGMLELWDARSRRWGRAPTDSEGRFEFTIEKPEPFGHDAPHFDVLVFARGLLEHQLTRIYFPDEAEANAADEVLQALSERERATLVARAEDGAFRFDVRLQGDGLQSDGLQSDKLQSDEETVFFAV